MIQSLRLSSGKIMLGQFKAFNGTVVMHPPAGSSASGTSMWQQANVYLVNSGLHSLL